MTIQYTINNYQLGAKLPTAPTHKMIIKERLDKSHTLVVFQDATMWEKDLMDKLFSPHKGLPYGKGFKNYRG